MRCLKLRSYLPAYCKNEVSARRFRAIETHLQTCASCREDLSEHFKVAQAVTEFANKLQSAPLSEEFNEAVLNRITAERYKDAPKEAYLPKRIPIFGWARIAGATVSVAAIALLVFAGAGLKDQILTGGQPKFASLNGTNEGPDAYLTAQPIDNPAFANLSFSNKQRAIPRRIKESGFGDAPAGQVVGASYSSAKSAQVAKSARAACAKLCFMSELARAHKMIRLSASMGGVQIIFTPQIRPIPCQQAPFVVYMGPLKRNIWNQPQIIIRPMINNPSPPKQTGARMVNGSF